VLFATANNSASDTGSFVCVCVCVDDDDDVDDAVDDELML